MKALGKPVKSISLRVLIVLAMHMIVSTSLHIIGGIIQGDHGPPSFLTPAFITYGIFTSILLILAYLFIGRQIPVKNKVLQGAIFILFFWLSDYLGQIMGMLGAESSVINPNAISVTTSVFDTIGYFVTGVLMGLLLGGGVISVSKMCKPNQFVLACIASMLIFPIVIFLLEMTAGMLNRDLLSYVAFGIAEPDKYAFYILFYLCQGFSRLLFPIFYRFTEYNSEHKQKWLRFSNIYGWMLWAPVVLIVIFFGTPVLPTIVFTVILILAIYVDTFIFNRILR